ncbi:succinoglycan biosynthesis transport protein ExoP [Rhizobium halophytocola]|uniref:non-specific protein-tyrosine kinase n=2 Tax=Rhizobium halophytocola TaxID=735519 RepID=A0ABS4DSR9_9HYPH|nr:Wzz/FepE/Etk N-terminal domain-containing protein [Rhizobium halophytocola]MBP1848736.1 succinoglycan biosynthesis transport protein ExoP [Rhizobium halophytocola]
MPDDDGALAIDVERVLAVVRRQWRLVMLCVLVAIVLGLIYLLTAVPYFTASTAVLIDRSKSDIVNQLSAIGSLADDEASVLSQVQIMRSETIAGAVVDKLKLTEAPEFTHQPASPLAMVKGFVRTFVNAADWFSSTPDLSDADKAERDRLAAIETLQSNMAVDRVDRSYVLRIDYTSPDPALSARIANTIASTYLLDKLNSKYDATRRASDWLLERIDELKEKALESDLAVQRFRADNGLVAAGGQLMSDQQLSELNSQLILARADTAKAKARYERIKSIIDSHRTDAIVDDVLQSSISNDLRRKYLEASKLEADISGRLGSNHIQAVRLRREMKEYERLMFEELGRIAESYQSDVKVAESREQALDTSVAAAQGVTVTASETQVQMRELERTADTYKNLYQTFLQRYQEATQQQSFPITDARVIGKASAPSRPSAPSKPLVLVLSVLLGGLVGSAGAAFREFRDRYFRTNEQVRQTLGVEFLGMAPIVTSRKRIEQSDDRDHTQQIHKSDSISSYAIDHPMSMFAETLRSAKIGVDLSSRTTGCKLVGIVSSLPSEGKSTIAVNFASLLAMQGARVLLIDADLRNPGATRALGRHAEEGLLEALLDGRSVRDLALMDPKTKLAFLPAVVTRRVLHSSELLASPAMNGILQNARALFDYVILDLPPLLPVVDARAIAPKLDSFLYVVEWGRTSRKAAKSALHLDETIYGKCAGAILNKVDEDKMKLYRAYGSNEYYSSRYASYYQEA